MVLARISSWQFREGKRPEAFVKLDSFLNSLATKTEGSKGYISILSYDDPNRATIMTLWNDEVALTKSAEGVLAQAIKEVHVFLAEEPKLVRGRVYSSELKQMALQK